MATINTNTKNTLPSAGSSFNDNLQTFLAEEDAERFNEIFGSVVISGGTHATGAGLAHTPTTTIAYVTGFYVSEAGQITYADDETTWVAVTKDTTSTPSGNFTRVSGTHYAIDSTSSSQPAAPTGGTLLMKVTTASGACTAVVDIRTTKINTRVGWTFSAKTASYTALASDDLTLFSVDATSGNLVITLPPAADVGANFTVAVKKSDSGSNTVTLDGNASETIDGSATLALSTQYNTTYVISNGTNWEVIANFDSSTVNIVGDVTPQLGGDLDTNTFNIQFDDAKGINDDSGNEYIRFQKIASAVNQFDITNAATGFGPILSATGGDTDIDITLSPKGTGKVKTDNLSLDGNTIASENANGPINITPNGSGAIVLDGLSWPTADGTSAQVLQTDGAGTITFGNKTTAPVTASQAEQETGTEAAKFVTPAIQEFHQSAAKGWVLFVGTGTPAISASYNVASITDNGVGNYDIVWDTDFSTANYCIVGSALNDAAGISFPALLTTDANIKTFNNANALTDLSQVHAVAFGDQ